MIEPEILLTDDPSDAAWNVIDDGLAGHGVEQAGYWNSRPIGVLVRGLAGGGAPEGEIVGGLVGRTSLGLLFIDLVYLPAELRGAGLGSRILRMAEEEAVRRGCCGAVLYTINFQAPGFYERHGWREFGRVPCQPAGTSRVFMTKTF
jgi:GNAT superfamily N-acetyltransferase